MNEEQDKACSAWMAGYFSWYDDVPETETTAAKEGFDTGVAWALRTQEKTIDANAARKLKALEKKLRCYETLLKSLSHLRNLEEAIEGLPPEMVKKKLKSAGILCYMTLQDPSVMDPDEIAESADRAMEALKNGECVDLDGNPFILTQDQIDQLP